MKCHKCNHISFDHLSQCRKCGVDLSETRTSLGFTTLSPQVPFLLGLLVGKGEQAQAEGGDESAAKDGQDDFAVIDMEDGLDLLDGHASEVSSEQKGKESPSGGGKNSGEFALSSLAPQEDEAPDDIISFAEDSEELDLSLSFEEDDDDEFFSSSALDLQEEEGLSGVDLHEKARRDPGDPEEWSLKSLEEEFDLESPETASSSNSKDSRRSGKKSGEAEKDMGHLEDLFTPPGSKDQEPTELALEEIHFEELFLEAKEGEKPENEKAKGASKRNSRAGSSRKK